jgi:hypothetical protein
LLIVQHARKAGLWQRFLSSRCDLLLTSQAVLQPELQSCWQVDPVTPHEAKVMFAHRLLRVQDLPLVPQLAEDRCSGNLRNLDRAFGYMEQFQQTLEDFLSATTPLVPMPEAGLIPVVSDALTTTSSKPIDAPPEQFTPSQQNFVQLSHLIMEVTPLILGLLLVNQWDKVVGVSLHQYMQEHPEGLAPLFEKGGPSLKDKNGQTVVIKQDDYKAKQIGFKICCGALHKWDFTPLRGLLQGVRLH